MATNDLHKMAKDRFWFLKLIKLNLQRFTAFCLFPVGCAIVAFRVQRAKYSRWQIGKCVYHGSEDFLEASSRAVEALSRLDKSLHESLISSHFEFWYEPAGLFLFKRHCGISKEYFAWGESGILVCMLFTYFSTKLLYEGQPALMKSRESSSITRTINDKVRGWLELNSFPPELIRCFA
ncbi:MAG: hypothetical protein JWR26_647 [Pedosphaera sp.]|nr:hypothetical protein [Pedosphaera sp.]